MYEIFEELMKKCGYTSYKVAKETGIAQSTLSDWKNGKCTPKIDKLQKIADLFGVTLEYLMTGEECEASGLIPEAIELFKLYESAPSEVQELVLLALKGLKRKS